ncbi:MAG: hypothetical protein WBA57_24185 [Elainellaceae cyanobacterium]
MGRVKVCRQVFYDSFNCDHDSGCGGNANATCYWVAILAMPRLRRALSQTASQRLIQATLFQLTRTPPYPFNTLNDPPANSNF